MAEKESTRSEARRPIPRWVWVLVAVLLVAGLVAGVSVFYANSRKNETTAPAPSSAPTAAAGGADGCIAGRDNDAKSLIEGAKKQAHTDEGAAATAAGFMRLMMQYPWASEKELTEVFTDLSVADNADEATKAARALRSTAGPETARTAGSSFADARYVVEPMSEQEGVRVSIAAQALTDGTLNGSSTSMSISMVWTAGSWKVADLGDETNETEILDNGAAFVGGC